MRFRIVAGDIFQKTSLKVAAYAQLPQDGWDLMSAAEAELYYNCAKANLTAMIGMTVGEGTLRSVSVCVNNARAEDQQSLHFRQAIP